jgi:hypothetical protein
MSEWHQKALDAARQGRWEEAIGHAKRSPPSYNTWQQLPSIATDDDGQSKMPAHAIHQVLDHLTKPFSPHKANLPEFLFEMASKLPDNLDSNTINRLADHGRDDYVVMNALGRHPNYKPDDRTSNLLNASDFWNQYERDVQPHHFATVKSMFTGAPEALTDHRGQTGSSREHMGLVPHLHEYAAEAQKKLLQDVHSGDDDLTKIRYFKGQPHVKVYRGVSGFYAEAIREAAGLDPATGEVDRKLLKIPVTHLASWSADPALAQRFATVEHPGHPAGQGIVLEKWMPVKDLLHSGYHNVVPNQNKVHPSESELVFAAPKGHIKVPTSGLHLYGSRDQGDMKPVKVRAHSSSSMPSVSNEPSQSIGKSEQEWGPQRLEKMSVKDIPIGPKVQSPHPDWEVYDYSHVLPEHHRKEGYKILVGQQVDPANPRFPVFRSTLLHPSGPEGSNLVWPKEVGVVLGEVYPEPTLSGARAINPDTSHIRIDHRHKGLGTAAYEALFAHGKNVHKAHLIGSRGMPHSTDAARVHESISRKHKSNYQSEHIQNNNKTGEFDFKRGPYLYQNKSDLDWHKSEDWDHLEKMAVADIPKGVETKPGVFDYSHVLTPEQREKGYSIHVEDLSNGTSKAWINHSKDATVGVVDADIVHPTKESPEKKLNVGYSKVWDEHRRQGVGTAAYEALFAHAKNHHGVDVVEGDYHSSWAHVSHKKVSDKHQMDYQAQRRPGFPNRSAPFDDMYSPYRYRLKSEDEWHKSESNLLHGANNAHTVQAMLGFSPARQSAFAAARFLAAGNVASLEQIRRALWEQDGDVERAALQAYGLPTDEKTVASLRAVMAVENLRKDEDEPELPKANTIQPGVPTATETAVQVRRAFDTLNVEYVKLPGKHSAGSMIAKDPESKTTFILKPGSGGQSPAAGASEDPSSQSRREAAYSAVARQWGVADVPQADLLLIDGKEYAALHMLGYNYQSAEKAREQNANMVRDAFEKVAATPTLFKWATLDFVLGNPDRHAQNIMVDKHGHIRLIDHGSAFAGPSFSPAHDKNSFVPYYLRFRYGGNFNTLPMKGKMEAMPRLNQEQERAFKLWLEQIDKHRLTQTLQSYGINPKPALARLAQLQLNEGEPADVTVNRAWAGA